MIRPKLERTPKSRKQDMSNLVRNWKSSGLPLSVLEENLRALAKEDRPKADDAVAAGYMEKNSFFTTYARGNSTRPRAAVTREDARLLLAVIAQLKKEVPEMGETPADAGKLVGAAAAALLEGELLEVPANLQAPLRRALLQMKPEIFQQSLF